MIKTASLENSKRLFELAPEWNDTHFWHVEVFAVTEPTISMWEIRDHRGGYNTFPAPDLEWLLDKLPAGMKSNDRHYAQSGYANLHFVKTPNNTFLAAYYASDGIVQFSDNASDAACLLLIKLIEQGVVKV